MPLYEHVFLARQDLAQAQVDALAENATKILEDNGGKVVKTETWGLKSLAYKIAKNRKAHFVMLDVDAPAPAIAERPRPLERVAILVFEGRGGSLGKIDGGENGLDV